MDKDGRKEETMLHGRSKREIVLSWILLFKSLEVIVTKLVHYWIVKNAETSISG